MTSYRSVNDTLAKLDELNGSAVQVEGILTPLSDGTIEGYESVSEFGFTVSPTAPSICKLLQSPVLCPSRRAGRLI